MLSTVNQITNFPITYERGNSYRTSGRKLSRVTVVNIHDVRSHGRNTQKWNTSAVHDIVRFRNQRMNVTILYLNG